MAGKQRAETGRPYSFSNRHALKRRLLSATAGRAVRRRVATAVAIALALLLGYTAIFGKDGITAYGRKRAEDQALAKQIGALQGENSRLREHVERLKTDPDAIAYEAHVRLRYARPGEVIVLNDSGAKRPAKASGSGD